MEAEGKWLNLRDLTVQQINKTEIQEPPKKMKQSKDTKQKSKNSQNKLTASKCPREKKKKKKTFIQFAVIIV